YGGMWLTISRPLYYREYLGGPLFIAQEASQQARRGLDSYLQFLALINIAIMAFNLLPIPVLDGGHMLLAVIEGIRRQSLSARAVAPAAAPCCWGWCCWPGRRPGWAPDPGMISASS